MKKIIRLKLHAGKLPDLAVFCVQNEIWTIFSYSADALFSGTEVTVFLCVDTEEKDELLKSKYINHIQDIQNVGTL